MSRASTAVHGNKKINLLFEKVGEFHFTENNQQADEGKKCWIFLTISKESLIDWEKKWSTLC